MEHFHSEMIPDPLPFAAGAPSLRQVIFEVLETIVLSLVLFLGINAVSARIRVDSVSMRETLYPGNRVVVNRLAYKLGEPGRGDVIVFDPPFDSPEPYVKRVIGLPGERIEMINGAVYIDGQLLPEAYVKTQARTNGAWTVPEDALFVMGDNRNNSSDSRSWGMVPLENVIGKALFVYWPPEQWGALAPSAAAVEATSH